ncbi:hypothetical protein BDY19DRAFT_289978 [Irpex rosettiformis]|uniref:Uncharacterized protein n=1 Tax=Irpex rosettiformis TaxID=378272 RepID=A0ACB8UI69_9APHY|nr:hypothetical protein BDY19DRAFT_289978 [Irpex rosettiformis]
MELPKQTEQSSGTLDMNAKPVAEAKPVTTIVTEEKKPDTQKKADQVTEKKPEAVAEPRVVTKPEEPIPASPVEPEEDPLWKVEDTKQLDKDGVPLIEKRGILLPESYWHYISGKEPISTAASIQIEMQKQRFIRMDPTWRALNDLSTQFAPLSTNAFVGPPPTDVPEYVKDMVSVKGEDEDLKNLDIPAYESWYGHPSFEIEGFLKQVNGKVRALLGLLFCIIINGAVSLFRFRSTRFSNDALTWSLNVSNSGGNPIKRYLT